MPPRGAPFQLTPEQLAIQAARRELKAQKANANAIPTLTELPIKPRGWATVQHSISKPYEKMKIMTWNMLAQSLVRRELFPGSDALKFSTRQPMLSSEIIHYESDILCLQEVDKLDTLLPTIDFRYSHIYATGRGKEHGCMILYNKEMFEERARQTVYYDEEDVRQGGNTEDPQAIRWRRGVTRATRNIGLISLLRRKESPTRGVVVATTHLFWHPAYSYERTRQVGLLLRAISRIRSAEKVEDWPCFLAGDFNLTPDDAAYSLLVNEQVTADQLDRFNESRLVHISIDPSIQKDSDKKPYQELTEKDDEAEKDGEGGGGDPDKVVTNSRACNEADGLLTFEEVQAMYSSSGMIPLRSIYDESTSRIDGEPIETISQRIPELKGRKGANEPMWSSYTHYWRSTLDYIYLFSPGQNASAEAILRPHKTEDLGDGLPKEKLCGSDHVSLAATVVFDEPM